MTEAKTTPHQTPGDKNRTEADVKSIDGQSGESGKSSHDEKSHNKAGLDTGVGGGKKQERHH
jgi:hypothetical protein